MAARSKRTPEPACKHLGSILEKCAKRRRASRYMERFAAVMRPSGCIALLPSPNSILLSPWMWQIRVVVYEDDVDAHYLRARSAGAWIDSEPVDQQYRQREFLGRAIWKAARHSCAVRIQRK